MTRGWFDKITADKAMGLTAVMISPTDTNRMRRPARRCLKVITFDLSPKGNNPWPMLSEQRQRADKSILVHHSFNKVDETYPSYLLRDVRSIRAWTTTNLQALIDIDRSIPYAHQPVA